MTMFMAVARPEFGVLAADRMWSSPYFRFRHGTLRKVAAHPHVGLAWATSGVVNLPRAQESLVRTVDVMEVASHALSVLRRDELSFDVISGAVDRELRDRTRWLRERLAAVPRMLRSKGPEYAYSEVVTVFHSDRGTRVGSSFFMDTAVHAEKDTYAGLPVTLGHDYLSQLFPTEEEAFGAEHRTVESLVRHVRRVIETCIDEEKRRHGRHVTVCGPVDVIVVDERGARPM